MAIQIFLSTKRRKVVVFQPLTSNCLWALEGNTQSDKIETVLANLIQNGEQDWIQDKELHLQNRIHAINNSIDNYLLQHSLTGKDFYQEIVARKKQELDQIESGLNNI